MVKSIFKETFIILLLSVAILLIISVLFYDYIPTNKVVPSKIAYATPENVREEIEEKITEIEKTTITYEITDADLTLYRQSESYKPGKANPFSLTTETNVNNVNTNSTGNETAQNPTNTTTDPNSTGTFFNETGKK